MDKTDIQLNCIVRFLDQDQKECTASSRSLAEGRRNSEVVAFEHPEAHWPEDSTLGVLQDTCKVVSWTTPIVNHTHIIAIRSLSPKTTDIICLHGPKNLVDTLMQSISKCDSANCLFGRAGFMYCFSYVRLQSSISCSQCRPSRHSCLHEGSLANDISIASPMLFQYVPQAQSSRSVKLRYSYLPTHLFGSSANRLRVYSRSSLVIFPAFWYRLCKKFMQQIAWIALSDVGALSANSSTSTPVSAILLGDVSVSASCPVATRSDDILGIP